MRHITEIKKQIFDIDYMANKEEIEQIRNKNFDFLHFMTINEPFWSQKMAQVLIELTNKFEEVNDQLLAYLDENDQQDSSNREYFHKRISEYRQHILQHRIFNEDINEVVQEMREDLQISSFNKYT